MRSYKIILAVALFSLPCFGVTCVAVGPSATGSGDGSNWSNMRNRIPGTQVANTIYYLADGTYDSQFITNNDGSAGNLIIVRKATATDQGQGCGIGTGWNTGTMGSSQAVFGRFDIHNSYWTVDGATHNSDGTGGGIKILMPGANCGNSGYGMTIFAASLTTITVQYVEIQGLGYGTSPDSCSETGIYIVPTSGTYTTLSLLNNYIHDITSGPISLRSTTGMTIQGNYIARDQSTSLNHAEAIDDAQSSNVTVRWNKFEDIVGSGVIFEVDDSASGTHSSNWLIYGNLFYWTPGNPQGLTNLISNGTIGCASNHICDGWYFVNNTISGCNWTTGDCGVFFGEADTGSSVTVRNNIWYNSSSNVNMTTAAGVTFSNDYDAFFQITGPPSETNGQVSSANPFVNVAAKNFQLASDTSGWFNTNSAVAGNSVDLLGNTRTSSRGAYQFESGGQATAPTFTAPASCPFTGTAPITVTLSDSNTGTHVTCYGFGTTPATNGAGTGCSAGTQYSTSFTESSSGTVNAISGTSTLSDSSVTSCALTVSSPTVSGSISGGAKLSGGASIR